LGLENAAYGIDGLKYRWLRQIDKYTLLLLLLLYRTLLALGSFFSFLIQYTVGL
jgi:hypothetical protein